MTGFRIDNEGRLKATTRPGCGNFFSMGDGGPHLVVTSSHEDEGRDLFNSYASRLDPIREAQT